jgi:hypothetical protein
VRQGVRDPDGAGAVMVALLLAEAEEASKGQLQAISSEMAEKARAMGQHTRRLDLAFHLPLIDLALATLKSAPAQAKEELVGALEAVVNADRRVSLHEFAVLTLVRNRPAQTTRLSELQTEVATVLGLVAHAGARTDAKDDRRAAMQAAIKAGASTMELPENTSAPLTLEAANAALQALRTLQPMQKGVLVKGLFAAVTLDGTIRVAEAGLMRVVGAVLDCPLPPLLASLDPATLAP